MLGFQKSSQTAIIGTMASRASDSEVPFEVQMDCEFSQTSHPFEVAPFVVRSVWEMSLTKPCQGMMRVAKGYSLMVINHVGAFVGRIKPTNKLILVPPESLLIVRENTESSFLLARGEHRSEVILWPTAFTPLLERQIEQAVDPNRFLASMPIQPLFVNAMQRFNAAIVPGYPFSLTAVMSVVFEVASTLLSRRDMLQLAALPSDLPETVRDLTNKVRAKPNGSWALKDAADMAGYSPFHFSRVFKAMAGYGFHEYVDRCRTETAAEQLCSTDLAVDVIASNCGFGTTQGLRESLKEYLGLVPSELRSLPLMG